VSRRSVTLICPKRATLSVPAHAMHIFDYIIFGVLIAIMLGAGAMALHKAR
jgi:hypothetical protein